MLDHTVTTIPSNTLLTSIESERRGQEAFARTRRRAYVENPNILNHLNQFVESGVWQEQNAAGATPRSLPLVITGDSGSGKSALLAHWSERYQREHPDVVMITHYVGATASSSDYLGLLRRIMLEIRERLDLSEQPPADPDQIVHHFSEWLTYVQEQKLVLVIDALNQLEDYPNHLQSIDWLPEDFPQHVRVVISTLDGPLLERMRGRGWKELQIEPLTEEERREVARQFLGDDSQRFNKAHIRQVAGNRNSGNPLYLRTSLEELRVISKRASADQKIRHYLEAEDLDSLYDRVLERIEGEYGKQRVSTIMRSIWGARYGLSKDELSTLSNTSSDHLDHILHGLDYHLMRRDGLYTFFHDHLRSAAGKRYAGTPRLKKNTYIRLGEYFASQPVTLRRTEEEPWHWQRAKKKEKLRECLTNIPLFCQLYAGEKHYEAFQYWQASGKRDEELLEEIYASQLEKIEAPEDIEFVKKLETIGKFLFQAAEYGGAERFYRRALKLREENDGEGERMAHTLTHLGEVLGAQGKYAEAEDALRGSLKIIEEIYSEGHAETASALDGLATLLYTTRSYDRAEPLFHRALKIRERALGQNHSDSIMSLVNLGALYFAQERSKEAQVIFDMALKRSEQALGQNHPLTAMVLNNMAAVLRDEEDYEGAIPLLERSMEINQKIFGPRHPEIAVNLMNLASFEKLADRLEDAESHFRNALSILTDILGADHPHVARCLVSFGALFHAKGEFSEAERMCQRALNIRIHAFGEDHISVHRCWLQIANAKRAMEKYVEAEEIYRSSLPIVIEYLGMEHNKVKAWYQRYIETLQTLGKVEEAKKLSMEISSN